MADKRVNNGSKDMCTSKTSHSQQVQSMTASTETKTAWKYCHGRKNTDTCFLSKTLYKHDVDFNMKYMINKHLQSGCHHSITQSMKTIIICSKVTWLIASHVYFCLQNTMMIYNVEILNAAKWLTR